ncbi:symmetrical bis(5'-nucleosyl)-tetraphosphatase [Alteromonas sp. PRIM-21]|uniref:symmetrical bis(5'-nucleosyl)-tetraphosphatase n=1 Tax=Alteromonas sp. PRIM-21 TaxID=1454978 RepID=UPI0022B96016|nr:symmetrical bis(5'-nucleosyl)-tetraphosphatase [Alteromonas sp. PRIM-21]MCZ8529526.1 symmetrical bis(5'-nucleosyl)-tetraphosphatase [Alteromonas sp. PRIM-21]
MSKGNTYVIGDIQGCYDGLRRVLDKVEFDETNDKLFAVGDLVARGEDSLSTLRFLKSLGSQFSSVLGNHDLHLLAVVNGIRKAKKSDKLEPLLYAADLTELVDWLRQFPLAAKLDEQSIMVHAGLYPQWSIDECVSLSDEVSNILKSDDYATFLSKMYGNTPDKWSDKLEDDERLRFIVNACTRMRFVHTDGTLDFDNKSHPSTVSNSPNSTLKPWFEVENTKLTTSQRVIFGHWAALSGHTNNSQFVGLDTGYVWGQSMTLLNLDTSALISVTA